MSQFPENFTYDRSYSLNTNNQPYTEVDNIRYKAYREKFGLRNRFKKFKYNKLPTSEIGETSFSNAENSVLNSEVSEAGSTTSLLSSVSSEASTAAEIGGISSGITTTGSAITGGAIIGGGIIGAGIGLGNLLSTKAGSQDTHSVTLPFSNNIGPGNVIQPPRTGADAIARIHDLSYGIAKKDSDVFKADKTAISEFTHDAIYNPNYISQLQSLIGSIGLSAKHTAERILGKSLYGIAEDLQEITESEEAAPESSIDMPIVQLPTKMDTSTGESSGAKRQKIDNNKGNAVGTGAQPIVAEGGGSHGLQVPRGINILNHTFIFQKTWKLLSYGVGDVILPDTVGGCNRLALTTSLANIPWEYAFFYISPAEWNSMNKHLNVSAVKCVIEITQYNPRVAFETNASTSGLATLNQNKFIRIAKGIRQNSNIVSSDRDYTFDAKNPMKPTGFDTTKGNDSRAELMKNYYGVDQTDSNISKYVPAYATGHELALQRYLTIYTSKSSQCGFPPYNNMCSEFNAVDTVGSEILTVEHEFIDAPLTKPHDIIHNADLIESKDQIYMGLGAPHIFNTILTVDKNLGDNIPTQAVPTNVFINDMGGNKVQNSVFDGKHLYTNFPMEQNGIYSILPKPHMAGISQQSIHVGIRPVPQLTTSANLISANEWSDTQIYWTVKATLICQNSDPFTYIHNKPFTNVNSVKVGICHENATTNPKTYENVLQSYDFPYQFGRPLVHAASFTPLTRTATEPDDSTRHLQHDVRNNYNYISDLTRKVENIQHEVINLKKKPPSYKTSNLLPVKNHPVQNKNTNVH